MSREKDSVGIRSRLQNPLVNATGTCNNKRQQTDLKTCRNRKEMVKGETCGDKGELGKGRTDRPPIFTDEKFVDESDVKYWNIFKPKLAAPIRLALPLTRECTQPRKKVNWQTTIAIISR